MLPFCVSKEVCLSYLQSQQTCDFLPRTAFYNKKVRLIKAIVLENMRAMHLYLLFPIKRPPGVQWQGGSGCRWLYCSEPRHGNCRVDTDTLCSLEKCHRLIQDASKIQQWQSHPGGPPTAVPSKAVLGFQITSLLRTQRFAQSNRPLCFHRIPSQPRKYLELLRLELYSHSCRAWLVPQGPPWNQLLFLPRRISMEGGNLLLQP